MHFWIDKRSQTCGFNNRHRVPASLSSGSRRRSKQMVTPIHRLQGIDNGIHQQYRRPQSSNPRSSAQQFNNSPNTTPTSSTRTAHAMELDSSFYLDLPIDGNVEQIQNLNKVKKNRINYIVLVTTAVSTSILGLSAYYFDFLDTMGPIRFLALVVVFVFGSIACQTLPVPVKDESTNEEPGLADVNADAVTSLIAGSRTEDMDEVLDDVTSPTLNVSVVPETSPPPYHIAVLLPTSDDSPPPPYANAIS